MKRFLLFMVMLLLPAAARGAEAAPPDYGRWAVAIVAGDDHAHDGSHSEVFDNARKALVEAFSDMGFSPANMIRFSVQPGPHAQTATTTNFADGLWDLTTRARAGCLIYFTSHGTPDGIVMNDAILTPHQMSVIVDNACGHKPSVIVMSACFSGQFVPALAGADRVVITAARADRTSFGCGALNMYTYFDDCFLRALPMADDFTRLGALVQECVAFREKQTGAEPPSDPQVSVGADVKGLSYSYR